MSFRFHMLGPFEVRQGDTPVALPRSKKARAVLAYVAMRRRPVPREKLVELFFAETRDPKGGLRWVVSRLRSATGADLIETTPSAVGLHAGQTDSDVAALERPLPPDASIEMLDRTARLVRGDFLADLSVAKCAGYEAWRLATQVRINNQYAAVLAELVRRTLGSTAATDYARKLVDLDVSSERSWACLVESLLASDQLHDARHAQQLALQQLERDGVTVGGTLEGVWHKYAARKSEPASSSPTQGVNGLGLRPRVAVLPCRAPAGDPSADISPFADAVFRACNVNKTVTVLALSLSEKIADAADNPLGAAQELSIDLLLDTTVSLRRHAAHVQVELTDVATGECLFVWTRKIEASSSAAAADRLEAYLSARMEIDLPLALIMRLREQPAEERTARDCYLLALPRIFSAEGLDPEGAYELLETAVSHQPYFGQACCVLSFIRMFMPQYNDDDAQIAITLSLARRAVEICQDDAFALGIAAVNIAQIERDTNTGLDLTNRALSINPNSIMARLSAAMISHYGGDDDTCLAHVDAVASNSEIDPVTFEAHTCRAMAYYQKRDYEAALTWSRKAVGHNPRHVIALRYLLASLAMTGHVDEARELAGRIFAVDPSENIAFFERRSGYCDPQRLQHLCDGLRRGGLPETA